MTAATGDRWAAEVGSEGIRDALRGAIKAMERLEHDHYGFAHPVERPFKYRPDICPACRLLVVKALERKELLYV